VSTISRSLKALAKELNIPIVALSQLNRGVENREGVEGKRPQLSDLRESGAIEQDADMVCFIHRPEYYKIFEVEGVDMTGKAEFIIAKHRNGATDLIRLRFHNKYARFEDYEDYGPAPLPGSEYPAMKSTQGDDVESMELNMPDVPLPDTPFGASDPVTDNTPPF
jgi:replicative DNA helicase